MLNNKKYKRILLVTRVVLIIIPVAILLYSVNKKFVPFGEISETYSFKKQSVVISELGPESYVDKVKKDEETGNYYQEIIRSPVYFYVNLPFDANFVDLDIGYENKNVSIFQLGIPNKKEDKFEYVVGTIENRFLENLGKNALIEKKNDTYFLRNQRNNINGASVSDIKKQNEISDYLNNLPSNNTVAFYQVDPNNVFRLNNYSRSFTENSINTILRGSHDIVTYIENEKLDYTFYFKKRNSKKLIDEITVKLYRDDQLIEVYEHPKSTIINNEEFDRKMHITKDDLPAGIYTLKIITGSNTNIGKISTFQKYMAFKGHIYLDDKELNSTYYVSSNLTFKTSHSAGLQEVKIDGEGINIAQLNKYYGSQIKNGVRQVMIPKSDIKLEFDGIASTSPEDVNKLTHDFNIVDLQKSACKEAVDFDYALTKYYNPIVQLDDTRRYTETFNINDLFIEDNRIKFKLSIPCIDDHQNVRINEIKVKLRR
jgi:hypothetical protein